MEIYKKEYLEALKKFVKADQAFDENPNKENATRLSGRRISIGRFEGKLKYTEEFLAEPKTLEHAWNWYRHSLIDKEEFLELKAKILGA